MNRFPKHYHEQPHQPLTCHICDQKLTDWEEREWSKTLPFGTPTCFDCASEIEVEVNEREELIPKRKRKIHVLSSCLFATAVAMLVLAAMNQYQAGYFIMATVACLNLGVLSRICRW